MEMQIFKNSSFGEVRVSGTSEEPLFCLADICKAVGLKNPSSVKVRLDEPDLVMSEVGVQTGFKADGTCAMQTVKMTFVNESGFYDVLLQSDAPQVKPFRKWVTSEVLPSIRKHGAYATEAAIDNIIANPDFGIKLLQNLKEEHQKRLEAENYSRTLELQTEEQEKQLKISAPKLKYFEDVISSTGLLTVNMIAQCLGISAIKLNKLIEAWGIQYKQSGVFFLYSMYRDKGYATHKPKTYTDQYGVTKTNQHLYWTELGKAFLINKYNNEKK